MLFDEKRPPWRRRCAPTAAVALGAIVGSIHKIGALAQGLPACNGWTFWRTNHEGADISIDELRMEFRARVGEIEEG